MKIVSCSRITPRIDAGENTIISETNQHAGEVYDGFLSPIAAMGSLSLFFLPPQTQEDGDLLGEEFDDIWDRAPKFPDVESRSEEERIDVDSFVQVYRDIDDLFEDEDDDEDDGEIKDAVAKEGTKKTIDSSVSSPKANSGPGDKKDSVEPDLLDDEEPEEGEIMEEELESSFDSICDASNLVSKEALMGWDEVSKLLEDGLLGEDELDDLWEKTKKSPGSEDMLDVDGFLSFNVALDGLFDFEDEDEDDEDLDVEAEYGDGDDVEEEDDESASGDFVEGENLPKGELFDLLSNQSGRLNGDGLLRWTELREMLEDGDLLESELDSIFKNVSKDGKEINKDEFVALCGAIDELFEEDEDDGKDEEEAPVPPLASSDSSSLKEELLDMLNSLEDPDLLPCGLESSESEQRIVLELVTELERQETNLVRARGGNLDMEDLAGTWDLLYSSSSAMRYNKGLSGLGGSVPNGKFGGLKQKLKASKFMADVEYLEQINVTPSSASFEVKVTGDWDLRRSVSLFTGEPSLVLTVLPGQVIYGPTSTKADHWKSIGPLNMLDITYLDENLRIMRGNTAVENIFVFRRSS